MNEEKFLQGKDKLLKLAQDTMVRSDISKQNIQSLKKLLELLSQYSFENRMKLKGLLTHTIIDSLELDYHLGEMFIKFDDEIN